MRYSAKWPVYAQWWNRMTLNTGRAPEFEKEARYAIANKQIYLEIAAKSAVTWPHIAVLHRREADGNFKCYLGNGQSLYRTTTLVPAGRGPFSGANAFCDGALDALRIDGLSAIKDWRLEKILYYCELFNGAGYDMRGLPSPYVWGGTNIQKPGKFTGDHKFNSRVMDPQPGCAPLLATIARLDPTVQFVRES